MSCSLWRVDERDWLDVLTTQRSPSVASISNAVTSSKPASTPARLAIRPDRSPTTSSRRSFLSATMNRPETASYARPTASRPGAEKLNGPAARAAGFVVAATGAGSGPGGSGLAASAFAVPGFAAGGTTFGAEADVLAATCRAFARGVSRRHPAGPGFEFRPGGERPHAGEVIARRGVGHDTHRRYPLQHHERVARPSAQALRSRHQRHQRRIVLRAGLQRAPREVVKRVVVLRARRRRAPAVGTPATRDSPEAVPRVPPR